MAALGTALHEAEKPGVEGLRIDIMSRLRDLSAFDDLWERRTVIGDAEGNEFHLLSVPDLVQAKKTQRSKDWPVIEALVAIHFRENATRPQPEWIKFWLAEARSPELIIELTARFPTDAATAVATRPLLALARAETLPELRAALDAEVRVEQDKDRLYWEPLKREMEAFRRAERG